MLIYDDGFYDYSKLKRKYIEIPQLILEFLLIILMKSVIMSQKMLQKKIFLRIFSSKFKIYQKN
jgi:hypothetical protein